MLYVIAGNGAGPVREVQAALKDLHDKASQEKTEFWVVLEGKDEPTDTDKAILKWLTQKEVWFEVYTSSGTTYDGAQDTIASDDVYGAFMERIAERAAESEEATVLALLPDEDEEVDDGLVGLVEAAIDADVPVLQLNGELVDVSLSDENAQAPPEPPEPVKAAKKAAGATKKAATKAAATKAPAKKAAAPVADDELPEDDGAPNDPDEAVVYTPEELAKMSAAEVASVARGQGIDPKGMGKRDLISAIQAKLTPVAVNTTVETATYSNGDSGVIVVIHLPGSIVVKHVSAEEALALAAT